MTIEIKQLLIKSTVQQQSPEPSERRPLRDLEELRKDLLEECRDLIYEILEKEKER